MQEISRYRILLLFQDKIDEVDALNKKLKNEIKKCREREKELGIDLELAKDNLGNATEAFISPYNHGLIVL